MLLIYCIVRASLSSSPTTDNSIPSYYPNHSEFHVLALLSANTGVLLSILGWVFEEEGSSVVSESSFTA